MEEKRAIIEEWTTIPVSMTTKKKVLSICKKEDRYDDMVSTLVDMYKKIERITRKGHTVNYTLDVLLSGVDHYEARKR